MTSSIEPVTIEAPHRIRRPVMIQGWNNLAAIHWRYRPDEVQVLLPDGFTVDTFDGSAWVGLIPFQMNRIRVPGLRPFGRWSTFPETNVRTYIVDPDGRRGVWFLSLDINRLVPTMVARITYRLPYCWSSMRIGSVSASDSPSSPNVLSDSPDGRYEETMWTYESRRRWPKGDAASLVSVRVGRRLDPEELTDLDHFLSARWALGTRLAGRIMWAKVAHPAWSLHEAKVVTCDESLLLASGLSSPLGDHVVRWSPGVEVAIERPRMIRKRI